MAVRIPAHYTTAIRALGLKTWANSAPTNEYYDIIEFIIDKFTNLSPDGDVPDNARIVVALAEAIDFEGNLELKADKQGLAVDTAEDWKHYCVAAAWCLLQRYHREKEAES